jgi:hypothetical protein
MRNTALTIALLSALAWAPAYAEDDKAKTWCTDAHMQEMDSSISAMTDADKQKEAKAHLDMSREAMQKQDMTGCVEHMKETHKAMGL